MKSKQHATSMASMQGMMDRDVQISSNSNKYMHKHQEALKADGEPANYTTISSLTGLGGTDKQCNRVSLATTAWQPGC